MMPSAIRPIICAAALLLLATPVASQAQDRPCLTVPAELTGYRLTETKVFDDSANGTSYRFTNGSSDRVTVFVYPIRAQARVGDDMRQWVAAEGRNFKELFPVGVQRGWWQNYQMAFDHPDSVAVDDRQLPGYLVAGVTRNRNAINVEFEYVFVICDRFVKMRASLNANKWEDSTFPNFAKALAAYLDQH